MSPATKRPKRFDWYTVTVDTLRGWGFVVVLLVLGVVGAWGYRYLNQIVLEREVTRVIKEAEDLLRTVRNEGAIDSYREEYFVARQHLEEARNFQQADDLENAFRSAERSRTLLASILSTLRLRGPEGEAMFIAAQGRVEFRRGERGSWQEARSRVALNAGDYVKTSGNGSAEIMTVDGTLYTVRPNTVLLIGRVRPAPGATRQRTINLESGWVDLGTAQSASRITTPQAEARVQRESTAAISHDPVEDVSRFATYRGAMVVSAEDGTSRDVGPLEQVTQQGESLSRPMRLPATPVPLAPEDNFEALLAGQNELVLSWQPVPGARSYALQVSRNRFFIQNIIEVENRSKTSARLGLEAPGSFVWRVAASDAAGLRGPWSEPRRFRVTRGTSAVDGDAAASGTESRRSG